MPKYVYDPKLNMMVPQQRRGIDFAMTGEGLRITDYDKKVEFVITREGRCKLVGRNFDFNCKIYDVNVARNIASRVQRVYPHSKYADFRYFCRNIQDPVGEQMTVEDKALLRSLSESYGTEDVMNFANHLDEGHAASVYNAQSSHGQTPGTSQHGLKGFINALPSLIVGFLVCPPAMILGWLGAVHERTEKRWLKTRINPNRWMDFVATPWERQKKVKEKIAEEMAANTNYYYTKLANGEILRVVGCSTLEAKEMAMAIQKKDIIPRYEAWNKQWNLTADNESTSIIPPKDGTYIMWVIKFNNGEACYAFGKPDASDKDEIMEGAIESRKAIVEYYKKVKYKDFDQEELGADDPQTRKQKHGGIGKERKVFGGEDDAEMQKLFAIPKIDDMIKIDNPGAYKIINDSNFKDFSVPQTSPMNWSPSENIVYQFNIEHFATITLPLETNEEANTFCKNITASTSPFAKKVREIALSTLSGSQAYYKVTTANEDTFIIPHLAGEGKAGAANNIKERVTAFTDAIDTAITNNNLQNETPISDLSIKKYRATYIKGNQIKGWDESVDTPNDGNGIYLPDWAKNITYMKIDSRTKRHIDGPYRFNEGVVDIEIQNAYNKASAETQDSLNKIQQKQSSAKTVNMTRETPDSSTQTKIGV